MFHLPDEANIQLIEGHFSYYIVILSVLIAFGASYTAIFINKQIQSNSFFNQTVWLTLASLAMGLGIWSMHFIGMSAFQLPVEMSHNILLTIISAVPAILASFIAFYLANRKKTRLTTVIFASIFMGLGISSMHYLGMIAMQFEASYYYKPVTFIVSIFIAMLASFAALMIFHFGKKVTDKILVQIATALLMAVAVSSMHYTGMFAIKFYTVSSSVIDHSMHHKETDFTPTIFFIVIGITTLFAITFLTSKLDRYVNFRIRNFDPLTSLPNQNQFMEDQRVNRHSQLVAIIHLNNFEKFISSYGYTFGDKILLRIQEYVVKLLPEDTYLYRTEGNRFTVVTPSNVSVHRVREGLENICAVLAKPIHIDERYLSVEMGVAVSQSDKKERIHDHFANAIAVLHSSTTKFDYTLTDYNPNIHTYNFERQLMTDLKNAMTKHELFLVYQPKINPTTNVVVGLEALIRWQHPKYGFISPGQFIPILENGNKINELTDWIIKQVCIQIKQWNELNIPFQCISINIPGSYVTSPTLEQTIDELTAKYNISPNQIELEITETSVINDIQNAITAVGRFRDKGFSIALDDFGTGLSSLSYLKEIPITTIKIDKSFVDDVPLSDKDSAILSAILNLCHSLDLNVVIEGVETQQQIDYLVKMDIIPIVQGYFYSKPLSSKEFIEFYKMNDVTLVH